MRNFVENEIIPYCHEWDEKKEIPPEFYEKAARFGILTASAVSGKWITTEGVNIPGNIKPEEW
jgi:hypothetical protein